MSDRPHPLSPDAPPPDGLDADAHVRRITEGAKSSFGPAFRLLPRPRREAMNALYAFSRVIDDVADEDHPLAVKRRLLDAWRAEVDRLDAGHPRSAIGRALARPVADYDLPTDELRGLIDGMAMDAEGPIVAPDRPTLALYVRRVAGTVGILSLAIFGMPRGPRADRLATTLARALQLTNILRDVGEDAEAGRLYLPRDLLSANGVPPAPMAALAHPSLARAMATLGEDAAAAFREARTLMLGVPRRQIGPALMMMGAYEPILGAIARRGYRPLPRVALPREVRLRAGVRRLVMPSLPVRVAAP